LATQGKRLERKQYLFNGQWVPSGDPLIIGEKNYATLQNLSYRNNGFLESVNGYSKINTTALATYLKARSGIQFINPLDNTSHILLHAQNSDDSARAIVENKGVIPAQTDFEAAVLHTDEAGAGLGRFSLWPNGTVAYCNGKESKVYSGGGMQVAACINYAPSGDFSYDYSEVIRNLETDDNNIAILHRVQETLDNSTVLLLHLDNSLIDSSPVSPHTVTNNNVTSSSSIKKFGTHSVFFNGSNAKLTIPDNGDFNFSGGTWAIDVWVRAHSFSHDGLLWHQETEVFRCAFSNGVSEPDTGSTLTGAVSGETSTLLHVSVQSGSWGGGDAAGYFYVEALSGSYQAGETLRVDSTDIADAGAVATWGNNSIKLCVAAGQYIKLTVSTHYDAEEEVISLSSPAGEISADVFYHIEAGEDGNTWYLFINGQLKASQVSSTRAGNYSSTVTIGYDPDEDTYFCGYMDEFRVSSCTRHTEEFEVPQGAYGDSDYMTYCDIGSTRPVEAIRLLLQTVNTTIGSLAVLCWNGTEWEDVENLTDGTAAGGVSLAQDGWLTFDSTVATAKARFLHGRALYWYRLVMTNADDEISVYHATVRPPFQSIGDLWDGIYRIAYDFQVFMDEQYQDYLLNVAGADYSTENEATFASIGELDTEDCILVGFDERMMALKVRIVGNSGNSNTAAVSVSYWDGQGYVLAQGVEDGTATGSTSMAKTGTISWNPPDVSEEFRRSVTKGPSLYYYRLSFSAKLSVDVKIDRVYGITAPAHIPTYYTFPFMFQNRAMLCGYEGGQEGNRVDYGMTGAADVFNGLDSSKGAGSLYFGGNEPLTGAASLYNLFGSSIYNLAVFCKHHETYALHGFGPDTWKIYQVSQKIGCPAPLTMDTAEIRTGGEQNVPRAFVIWLSYFGPVMFDGSTITPLHVADCYFEHNDERCINTDAIEEARGWVDSEHNEYNLLLPSGAGQTTCNVWLVIDLVRMKAFLKVPPDTGYPQAGFRVRDAVGNNQHVYGCLDTGYMMRLEHGRAWDGEEITCVMSTADILPSGDIWDYTAISRVKLAATALQEDEEVVITTTKDGMEHSTTLMQVPVASLNRHTRQVEHVISKGWSHQFTFTLAQSIAAPRFRPLAWGFQYEVVREDVTVTTDGLNKIAEQTMLASR